MMKIFSAALLLALTAALACAIVLMIILTCGLAKEMIIDFNLNKKGTDKNE